MNLYQVSLLPDIFGDELNWVRAKSLNAWSEKAEKGRGIFAVDLEIASVKKGAASFGSPF